MSGVSELEMLTPGEVAVLFGMSEDWCYSNRRLLGGIKNGRAVRFPVLGLQAYVVRKRSEVEAARPALGTRKATRTRVAAGPSDRSLLRLVHEKGGS